MWSNLDTKKKAFIIIAILLIAIAVYWMFIRKKDEEQVDTALSDGTGSGSTKEADPTAEAVVNDTFPLRRVHPAKRGKRVEQLQIWMLKNYGNVFPLHGVDGVLGDETLAAMKKFLNRDNISEAYFNKANMGAGKTQKFK